MATALAASGVDAVTDGTDGTVKKSPGAATDGVTTILSEEVKAVAPNSLSGKMETFMMFLAAVALSSLHGVVVPGIAYCPCPSLPKT